jgi:hypothetical protein
VHGVVGLSGMTFALASGKCFLFSSNSFTISVQKRLKEGLQPKALPPDIPQENTLAASPENVDSHFLTRKLDTLLKKKENMEFNDIKILLFFDMTTPDPHVFQSLGLELINHMEGFLTFDPPLILMDGMYFPIYLSLQLLALPLCKLLPFKKSLLEKTNLIQ